MLKTPQDHFSVLPDPRRVTRNKLHKLEDIVMITLCAVLCGFEDWVSIEDFGNEHEGWLRTFLELPNGIPSHDTLREVMGRIDKAAFSQAFAAWVQDALPSLAACHVALDGKCLRGSAGGLLSLSGIVNCGLNARVQHGLTPGTNETNSRLLAQRLAQPPRQAYPDRPAPQQRQACSRIMAAGLTLAQPP